MGDFKQNKGKRFGQDRGGGFERRDGGRPPFSGKPWGGDRDRGPLALHRATCAKCGASCEVPFRPVEGRPVYCRDCFQRQEAGENTVGARFPRKDYGDRNFSRPDFRNN
ncbi:MAG: hypothetical protein MUD10_02375, partial [Candidatus Pacebacteria bacterium]|nr:hypothetical protein [Candidatus Paceibacterota bacterium]